MFPDPGGRVRSGRTVLAPRLDDTLREALSCTQRNAQSRGRLVLNPTHIGRAMAATKWAFGRIWGFASS